MRDDLFSAHGLLERIHAVNGAWHALRLLWEEQEDTSPILRSMRTMKATLQAQLLRQHYPTVFLFLDPNPSLPEPCYSVALAQPIGSFRDGCHMPLRVAEEILTKAEQAQYVQEAS